MNQAVKRMASLFVLMMMLCILPAQYISADAPEEISQQTDELEEGQENITEEEVPLVAGAGESRRMFIWGGIAMVSVLAMITGYSSLSTEKVKK